MNLTDYLGLQTCSATRINKIKTILENSEKMIGKPLTKLTLLDITKFLREVNNSPLSLWTKNDYKKIFKSFIKWRYKKDFLDWSDNKNFQDGFKGVSKKKAFNKDKINKDTLLKPEELEKLLRSSKNLKWKALLTLLYESAFRPCELVQLKWKDLVFNDSQSICSIKTTSPKTKDTRTVPVKDCIVHLKRWREEYSFSNRTEKDYVFPNPQKRDSHLSEGSVGVMLKRICAKAGIRPIFPYLFRHSRIYEVQKKLGARLSSKFAGHSIETSEIYNHLDSDDVEEAMLEKIYVTKELSDEKKHELEIRFEQQQNALNIQQQLIEEMSKSFTKQAEEFNDSISETMMQDNKIEKQNNEIEKLKKLILKLTSK